MPYDGHIDPTHKGIMVELLQRGTSMKVFQIKDWMWVEAKYVYVIPPNKDMSIPSDFGLIANRSVEK